ncbi:MAG: YggS family pyridoxal phosphate-dependent enzyme [Acidobacteria bacterium]|nr:YggS family pyridoxal phosphate-dependent enzyme [Acidobacteriota bacterium]
MPSLSQDLRERIAEVRRRIAEAAQRAGRDPETITLVAVSKTVDDTSVLSAWHEGLMDFGENRVQEASTKIPLLVSKGCTARWHLIGHLQSNKAKRAMEIFDIVQSVDDLELARRLNRLSEERAARLPVFLEVNLGEEQSKSGFEASWLKAQASELAALDHLRICGLMIIPPYLEDAEQVRPYFRHARDLMAELNREQRFSSPLTDLSMGMSHDFEVAIEEGATLVRVGTAIFGPRSRLG